MTMICSSTNESPVVCDKVTIAGMACIYFTGIYSQGAMDKGKERSIDACFWFHISLFKNKPGPFPILFQQLFDQYI